MRRLSVPIVKVLAYFLKKGASNRFSSNRQNTSGKIEKVEHIHVLTACECAGNAFIKTGSLIVFYSRSCKEDIPYLTLPTLAKCSLNIDKSQGAIFHLNG